MSKTKNTRIARATIDSYIDPETGVKVTVLRPMAPRPAERTFKGRAPGRQYQFRGIAGR